MAKTIVAAVTERMNQAESREPAMISWEQVYTFNNDSHQMPFFSKRMTSAGITMPAMTETIELHKRAKEPARVPSAQLSSPGELAGCEAK